MSFSRLSVGLACNEGMYERVMDQDNLARLERLSHFRFEPFDAPSSWTDEPPSEAVRDQTFKGFCADLDAVIVGPGAPRITSELLEHSPSLRFIGELEGDRFARRIEMESAWARGIRVVDTTNGSSYPVAEWALGLMLVGRRNAGSLFRQMIAGQVPFKSMQDRHGHHSFEHAELTGASVGLISCGHAGRRLLELLRPFCVDVFVYDPYLFPEFADVYDVTVTSLANVLACEVVVCLAPLTDTTHGLIGEAELEILRPGAVFVNVSRGAVVNTRALTERVERGDVVACLDVFDPDPMPPDAEVRSLDNVFLSPHIAGVTRACGRRFMALMIDELERWVAGHGPRFALRPR